MKKLFFLLLSCLLLTGCQPDKKYTSLDWNSGFDTFISLTSYTRSQEKADEQMETTKTLFSLYNTYFDIYHTYPHVNNLKTINDNAGIAPVQVAPEIIECLLKAKEFHTLSHGDFDITMGAVLKVWHHYRDEGVILNGAGQLGNLPTEKELEEARACTGWQYVEIDEEASTVYITNPCVSLDIGGIAKGFAVEKIAQAIESHVSAAIVNGGGNTRTVKTKPDQSDWVSGIQNPENDGSLLAVSVKGSQSIVTSGDYQRFYVAEDGLLYHHIIDPKTSYPAMLYRSVTIITQDSGDADGLSTCLYTVSIEEGIEILNHYNNLHPDTPASAIWIMDKDKKIETKNGFELQDFYISCTDDLLDKLIFNP